MMIFCTRVDCRWLWITEPASHPVWDQPRICQFMSRFTDLIRSTNKLPEKYFFSSPSRKTEVSSHVDLCSLTSMLATLILGSRSLILDSWSLIPPQENGTLLLIFDAIGFELDLANNKQSTFIAPDSTMFNLVPGLSNEADSARTKSLLWWQYGDQLWWKHDWPSSTWL